MEVVGRVVDFFVAKVFLRGSVRTRVAIVHKGKVLLVKYRISSGLWKLPDGGVDKGETVKECASRELNEELGLNITADHLVHIVEIPPTGAYPFTKMVLKIELKKTPSLQTNYELSEVKWFDLNELPSNVDEIIKRASKLI